MNPTTKDENYVLGFEDGFRAGVESATDFVAAKTYDEAYSAGYRDCKEELVID